MQKVLKITSKSIHSGKVPVPNRITSSTKRRCVRPRVEEILIPLMRPCSLASVIKRQIPSITSIKSKGDKGQPYLIPLKAVKNFEGVPLIRTAKFVEVRHPIIQFTPRIGTPNWIKMRRM